MGFHAAVSCLLAMLLLTRVAWPAEATEQPPSKAERKKLDQVIARILEKDFKLVPSPTAAGGWKVGLAVRGYSKSEGEKGVRITPRWDPVTDPEVTNLADLHVGLKVVGGFCGGQERSFLVTVSFGRSPDPRKIYGVLASELGKLQYMDMDTCSE
jgi:hypothetical protein